MGFRMVTRVYQCVKGTDTTAQAILAYLAHRADDEGRIPCHPSIQMIHEATHFSSSAINEALRRLFDAKLLDWESGGRRTGSRGLALANCYRFNLPQMPMELSTNCQQVIDKRPKKVDWQMTSTIRQPDNALSASRTMHYPPAGQCTIRQPDTFNQISSISQPTVNGMSEAETDDLKVKFAEVAESWSERRKRVGEQAAEASALKRHNLNAIVTEAMNVCGVTDIENRKVFTSTIFVRDPEKCLDEIFRFASEKANGEYRGVRNLAALLNARLSMFEKILS